MTDSIELQLIDATVRHRLDPVALAPEDFEDVFARDCWRALLVIWCRNMRPTIDTTTAELVALGHLERTAALNLLGLPTGERRLVEDYAAIIRVRSRRRRLRLRLIDALDELAAGVDPTAVFARLTAPRSYVPGASLAIPIEPTAPAPAPWAPPAWRTGRPSGVGTEPFTYTDEIGAAA